MVRALWYFLFQTTVIVISHCLEVTVTDTETVKLRFSSVSYLFRWE